MAQRSVFIIGVTLFAVIAIGTGVIWKNLAPPPSQAQTQPRLPEEVRRLGITVRKSSPDILMVVQLFSPDGSRDLLYLSNYATRQIRDALLRIPGVGDVRMPSSRASRICASVGLVFSRRKAAVMIQPLMQ